MGLMVASANQQVRELVRDHPSKQLSFIHPGGHSFPNGAVEPIVDFFKRTEKPEAKPQ